jgi:astacin
MSEENSSENTIKVNLNGKTFNSKVVECSIVNGKVIFEGDIYIDSINKIKEKGSHFEVERGVIIPENEFRWPEGLVSYEIDTNLPNKQRITDAINHIEEKTKIRFIKRDSQNAAKYPNYVYFFDDDGCYSAIGMRGGKQIVSLGPNCTAGNCIHELCHTLGMWHEQSREDRDDHIQIKWENIDERYIHNFNQHVNDGDDIGNYDYGSILHYGKDFFTKNGNLTIMTPHGEQIGQRIGLSETDIETIKYMYSY